MSPSPLDPAPPTTPRPAPDPRLDAAGAVVPDRPPRAPHMRRPGRRAWWTGAVAVALGVAAWRAMPAPADDAPAVAPRWDLQLASAGRDAPWVLVFGRDAGLHLMRLPADGGRTTLPARVVDRKVWMMSLGRAPLDVRGDAGGAGSLRSFGARARVVTVFQDRSGTGVRTGLLGAMR